MAERILLVDDDEGFLLAAGHLLEAAGYEVIRAPSAAEARTKLESSLPDLILLDVSRTASRSRTKWPRTRISPTSPWCSSRQ